MGRITPELTAIHLHCAACGFVSFQKYHVRFRMYLLCADNQLTPVIQNKSLMQMGSTVCEKLPYQLGKKLRNFNCLEIGSKVSIES